jgi:hypothetical protein
MRLPNREASRTRLAGEAKTWIRAGREDLDSRRDPNDAAGGEQPAGGSAPRPCCDATTWFIQASRAAPNARAETGCRPQPAKTGVNALMLVREGMLFFWKCSSRLLKNLIYEAYFV